jgi:hypothetical protein
MKAKMSKSKWPAAQREALLETLKARFEKHMNRHEGLEWLQGAGESRSERRQVVFAQ